MALRLLARLRVIRRDIWALALAFRHPRTPWYAITWLAMVVVYAVSPIDLVPDPVPLLGYVDEVVLLPIGIAVGTHLVGDDIMDECRAAPRPSIPRRWKIAGATLVVSMWAVSAVFVVALLR